MRTCSKCKKEKEDIEFPKDRSTKSGFRPDCKECNRAKCKAYKANNKDKISAYNKEYKGEHKEETRIYNAKWSRERKDTNPQYKMKCLLRERLAKELKKVKECKVKNVNCTFDLLSIDIKEFTSWLQFLFADDMTLENHGTVWQLDHVIPCSMFDLTDITHQQICFHWANIRPMYSRDNIVKGDTLYWNELQLHCIKLGWYAKNNNHDISLYKNFIKESLEYTKVYDERVDWRMGNQLGIVKIIQEGQ